MIREFQSWIKEKTNILSSYSEDSFELCYICENSFKKEELYLNRIDEFYCEECKKTLKKCKICYTFTDKLFSGDEICFGCLCYNEN